MRTQDVLALAEQSRAYHQSNVSLVFLVDFAKRVAAAECERICSAIKAEPVQEPVAWAGYDLDGMVEAFSRVIEAHHSSKNPFHDPINTDARMALRILRGLIPAMKAYATPPQRPAESVQEPVAVHQFRSSPLPGCNRGNRCPWTDESKANGWRSTCRHCGLRAQGSGQ